MSNSKMIYKCVYCGIQYKDIRSMYSHLYSDHKNRNNHNENNDRKTTRVLSNKFTCAICRFKSDNYPTMQSHLLLTHGNKKKNIMQNEVPEKTLQLLDEKENKIRIYKCIPCSKYLQSETCCLEHIEKIHNIKIQVLNPTNFELSKLCTQKQNIGIYRCLHCSTFFNDSSECSKHIQIEHVNKKIVEQPIYEMPFNKMKKRLVYQCTVCSNLFSYRNTCFTHIIFAHFLKLPQTGDKVCQCPLPEHKIKSSYFHAFNCLACLTCFECEDDGLKHINMAHGDIKIENILNNKYDELIKFIQEEINRTNNTSTAIIGQVKSIIYIRKNRSLIPKK